MTKVKKKNEEKENRKHRTNDETEAAKDQWEWAKVNEGQTEWNLCLYVCVYI